MNTKQIFLIIILLYMLTGCSPEVGTPEDFRKYSELVEKSNLISKEELIEWLGEPERIVKISNIISETEYFRDYKEPQNKRRAEADVQFTLDSWYQRYVEIKGIPIDVNSKWSHDDAFLKSNIWGYYLKKPLKIKVAYRKWLGTTKQTTIKKSLFFMEIGENQFLAVPPLKRK